MCGRRLSLQFSKGTYTYFYCLGQKDRRNGTGCRERYVAADHLEAEVEDLYGRLEVPTDWAEGLREAVAAEVASRHEDTTAERELLATQHERLESERYKLMEAYYANAIDVTMLRREQERIGVELRTIESRQGVLDGSLDGWQDVMDLALRFSTRCATGYRRAGTGPANSSTPPCSTRSTSATATSSTRPTRSRSTCSSLRRSSNTEMWWAVEDSNL